MKFLICLAPVFCAVSLAGEFVAVPANPDFAFAEGIEEGFAGEKSPILKKYEISKFPVTNGEYKRFLAEEKNIRPPWYWKNGTFPNGKERHPVLGVSLADAKAYCAWRSKRDKKYGYRIPSEAEWEFAAVGNTGNSYPWGNGADSEKPPKFNCNRLAISALLEKNPDMKVKYAHPKSPKNGEALKLSEIVSVRGGVKGWKNGKDHTGFVYTDLFVRICEEGGLTVPVDRFPEGASPFGAMDMSGNSWDWTDSEIVAANGAERGKKANAIRGGSWYATARSCRATFRGEGRNPEGRYNTVGFRIVREPK